MICPDAYASTHGAFYFVGNMAQVGRPPKYETPEQMQEVVDRYFDGLDAPPTITGLAFALGFDSRSSFLYYQEEKPEFLNTIKRAKMRVEVALESELVTRPSSVTGLIFNLKNNFGWKDAQEHTHVTEEDGERKPLRFV